MNSISKKFWLTAASVAFSLGLSGCGGGGDSSDLGSSSGRATLLSIEVKLDLASVPAGAETTARAIGHFSDGAVIEISDASSVSAKRALTSISWSAAPNTLASFFSSQSGTVRTNLPGSVVVTATDFFSGVSGTTTLSVTAPVQTRLTISGLNTGQTISARTDTPLAAAVVNTDGSVASPASLTWTSSNTSVAKVDTSGRFQGVGAGAVTITATSGSFTKSISLTLLTPLSTPLVKVSCDPSHPTVINAQQWSTQFAIDNVNATEWIVVDGASCQSYAVVKLLVPSGSSSTSYYGRFAASRSPTTPATFQPGTVLNTLTSGQAVSIGSATKLDDFYFTELYSTTAQ